MQTHDCGKLNSDKEAKLSDLELETLFSFTAEEAAAYRKSAGSNSPYAKGSRDELRAGFGGPLPEHGVSNRTAIEALVRNAGPGLVGTVSPAAFGWVMGGSHPAGVAADWLTSAWGQNAGIFQTTPASAVAEEVAASWLLDLLGLPSEASVGFTTGATMAGFTCLAAARGEILRRYGWDIDADGLAQSPRFPIFLSEEAHTTIYAALRYLGFGRRGLIAVKSDEDGRMDASDLEAKIRSAPGPGLVIAQAGHINSGAMDDFSRICALAQENNSWVHVDGAFGLWARASGVNERRNLCKGADQADSWSVDGHKWLQVPYDCGYAIVRDADAHQRAMSITASYLNRDSEDGRIPSAYVPELSRRARGFATWSIIKALGRTGVAELVDGACDTAYEIAESLAAVSGIEIIHKVFLNQIALSFDDDTMTQNVIEVLQEQGKWFVKGAVWKGRNVLRLSFISAPMTDSQKRELAEDIIAAYKSLTA